jgi:hemoglobin-like flavoprotein
MTAREISLIRTSFQKLTPIAEQTAGLFYARLFELDPSLRELFRGNLTEQGPKLMQMIRLAVNGLDHFDTLAPVVRQLGRRHAVHHVRESHYDTVGEALLWALARALGAEFTLETRIAWGKTYWLLAETLRAGVRDATASQNRAVA